MDGLPEALHLVCNNAMQQYRMGIDRGGSNFREDPGMPEDNRLNTVQQCAPVGAQADCVLGCTSKNVGRRARGVTDPLHSACARPDSGVQVEAPQYKKNIVSCPSNPTGLASVLHQASSGAGPGDIGGAEDWAYSVWRTED